MFEPGFLGTRALGFMDVVTIWFAVLPFLMAGAIFAAMQRRYVLHSRLQTALFAVTLAMVVIFEVGVRLSGGFLSYAEGSSVPLPALATLLGVHILIAVAAVALWAWVLVDAWVRFRRDGAVADGHRRYAQFAYAGMTVTSFLGVLIYLLLFVL